MPIVGQADNRPESAEKLGERSACTRSFTSLAALLVKVMAKIFAGLMFSDIKKATLWVKHLVFPEPGPEITKTGPLIIFTASICFGFKFLNMSLIKYDPALAGPRCLL